MDFTWVGLAVAAVVALVVMFLGYITPMLRDQLVPQLPWREQTFSLARSQMAWWFITVLGCYLYLWLHDAADPLGILNGQAVVLLGISAATAGGAAAVDDNQDTPEDALNDAMRQLGLNSYEDVVVLRKQIANLGAALAKDSGNTVAQSTLNAKQLLLTTYEQKVAPFKTRGWLSDMVTDVNGATLHRLQAVVWTLVFGAVFVFESVKSGHSMPVLDDGMLALMGVSGAGYVGFKYNETQY